MKTGQHSLGLSRNTRRDTGPAPYSGNEIPPRKRTDDRKKILELPAPVNVKSNNNGKYLQRLFDHSIIVVYDPGNIEKMWFARGQTNVPLPPPPARKITSRFSEYVTYLCLLNHSACPKM